MVTLSDASTAILNAYKTYQNTTQKVNSSSPITVKTTSTGSVPTSFQKMQQALSEKFGIPTFDFGGKVSTLPRTRPLNTDINVGVGSTGLAQNAFNDLLKRFTPSSFTVPKEDVFIPGIGGNITQPVGSAPAPGELKLPSGGGILDIFKTGLGQIGATGLIIGGVVLAILLLKK